MCTCALSLSHTRAHTYMHTLNSNLNLEQSFKKISRKSKLRFKYFVSAICCYNRLIPAIRHLSSPSSLLLTPPHSPPPPPPFLFRIIKIELFCWSHYVTLCGQFSSPEKKKKWVPLLKMELMVPHSLMRAVRWPGPSEVEHVPAFTIHTGLWSIQRDFVFSKFFQKSDTV